MWMQSKSPYSLQMRENMDQKDSEYRNFLWSVFNSFSIFFGDKSHVGFLSYLVLVYTALRNSNNFFCENLTNLLPSLLSRHMSMSDPKWVHPRAPPSLHLFFTLLWWIPHICPRRSVGIVRKYTYCAKTESLH